jgi:FkbM family methyltransferase
MTTEQLLAERVEDARTREFAAFEKLSSPTEGRMVLSGAGVLGQKVLAALRIGLGEPLTFADIDPSLEGKSVAGLAVQSPEEAAATWGSKALFIVTTFRPLLGDGIGARMMQLSRLGCRWTTSFLETSWRFPGVLPHFGADLPSKLLEHAQELRKVNSLLHDEASREVFRQQLTWRLRGDFSSASKPVPDQYFPLDIIIPCPDERIVDGGAFDGDTLRNMPLGYSHAWAIEPDPWSVARIRLLGDERAVVFEAALGSRSGRARFDARGTPASSRAERGHIEVTVSRLDDLLSGETPTYLKLDVEGDELAALHGATELLRRAQPVVAVCVYHRPDDLWRIPLLLHELLPRHRHFLRVHENDGFELVAYAVPRPRCR